VQSSGVAVAHFISTADTNKFEITIELVGSIYDGLAYGNWPWVLAEMNKPCGANKKAALRGKE
jgi:hypothetical protein